MMESVLTDFVCQLSWTMMPNIILDISVISSDEIDVQITVFSVDQITIYNVSGPLPIR